MIYHIINQGNVNPSHNEDYDLKPVRMVVIKKTNAGKDVEKRKYLCTIGENVNS